MFTQKSITAVAAITSIFLCGSNALVAREPGSAASPSTLSVSHSTYSALASEYPGVMRDNGGGGNIGGHTLMVFSDTTTDRPGLWEFTSNSYAYATNPNDPTAIQDFGGNEVPAQAVPWAEGECMQTYWRKTLNRALPGIHQLITAGGFGLTVYALVTQFNDPTATEAYAIYGTGPRSPQQWQYNTLVHWTVTDTGVNATRPVQKYITSDFKYQWGYSVASHTDGNVRIFASDSGTLYLAIVAWDDIADTSKFTYWDGTQYQADESKAAAVGTGDYYSGDVWWSPFYKNWISIFMGPAADATFYVQYSTSGNEWGPYSEAQAIFSPTDGTTFCYAGHSYPQFFSTEAQEVLLTWTYQDPSTYTRMAKLTFSL